MLQDQLKLALQKQNTDVVVRSSTNGSLKNSRSGIIPFVKISQHGNSLHYPKSNIRMMQATKHSKRYSESSVSTRTRLVALNTRGMKQDKDYLNKDYQAYQTTYKIDFPQSRDMLIEQLNNKESLHKSSSVLTQPISKDKYCKYQYIRNIAQLTTFTDASLTCSTEVPNLLDQISVNDPIWSYLIPENILKDPNINLEKVIEDNYEYFQNFLGLALQEKPQRDFTFSKLSLPQFLKLRSSYSQQFSGADNLSYHQPTVTAEQYETQKPLQLTLSNKTSYQQFFQVSKTPQDLIPNFKQIEEKIAQPMSLLTSYQQNYLNWQSSHEGFVKKEYFKNTGNLPFIGKSSYSSQYLVNPIQQNIPSSRKSIGPFVSKGDMVYKTSQNSETYRPIQITKIEPERKTDSPKILSPDNYLGQFRTTSQRQNATINSPVRKPDLLTSDNKKIWKKLLLLKFQELRMKK